MLKRGTLRIALLTLGLPIGACNCDEGGLVDVHPELELGAESIDFGDVPVGDLRLRSLHLRNKGEVELSISKFEITSPTGEFLFATSALTKLNAQEELDFNLVFEPHDEGEELGSLTIEANDGKGTRTVSMRGVGVIARATIEHGGPACGDMEGSLSFGSVAPLMMVEKTIVVRASGTTPITVLSAVRDPGTSGEFAIEELSAPQIVAPGDSLSLRATYMPVDGGPDIGTFVITTDAPSSPTLRVEVCGEGAAPALCATPLAFGPVAQNSVNRKTMTVTSCGPQPVDVSAIALATDAAHLSSSAYRLSAVPAVPQTLAPMATMDIEVEFTAGMALGAANGWVEIDSSAYGQPKIWVPVTANVAEPCGVFVAPMSLTWSSVAPMTSDTRALLVANSGASSCIIPRIEVTLGTAVFSLNPAPTLPLMIPTGGSETLQVQYSPTVAGMQDDGTLEIEDMGGSIISVPLSGNPTAAEGCQVEVVPAFVNFGVVPPNTVRSMAISLNNISQDFCTLRDVELDPTSDPAFTNTAPSFGIILPGRSKTISITYRPTVQGAATGGLNITTSDVDSPTVNVPLFASAAPTGICVTPRDLPFGPVSGMATLVFTISACGTQDVTVTALDWTMPDTEFYVQSPPALPFTLVPGASQDIFVAYQPTDVVGDTAVVTVRSDDLAEPAIDVTCTGGPEIVPPSAGKFLYYWQIPGITGGDIVQLPLQGNTTPINFWGPRNGKPCTGCHNVSPDGRYVAVVETTFRIIDTQSNISLALPNQAFNIAFLSWRPDVNTNPPYQYAWDDTADIHLAALFDGDLGLLSGADDSGWFEQMPSWGPNGQIAFARSTMQATGSDNNGTWGLSGPADIMIVPETGGTAVAVPGASGNGQSNYYPRFSPNGTFIAFTQSAQAGSTIAASDAQIRMTLSDLTGTTMPMSMVNGNNGASSFPTWSVDGSFLSFSSNRSGGAGDWDIYIAPVDTNTGVDGAAINVIQANTASFEHSAQWSP